MNLEVKLVPDFCGSVSIIDTSRESGMYTPEDSEYVLESYDRFKFSDTCTIDIVEQITTDGDNLINTYFTTHSEETNSIRVKFPKDGYYVINHIVLPTLEWYDKVRDLTDIEYYTFIYLTDGRHIYKRDSVTLKLYVVNPLEVINVNPDKTTISMVSFLTFSIDELKHCYLNASKNLFDGYLSKCKQVDELVRFNRDFIWMTINVISFYLEENKYSEALILLEKLGCYSFCPTEVVYKQTSCNCQN